MREELVEDAIRKGLAYLENAERAKRENLVIYIPVKGEGLKMITIPHENLPKS